MSVPYYEDVLDLLELLRGVDLVRDDVPDGLVRLVHQLDQLGGPALVDVLDEGVVLLPERHLGTASSPAYSI